MMLKETVVLGAIAWMLGNVSGHGRLLKPPSRASMHRYKTTDPMLIPYQHRIESNFDDAGLNCGGRDTQTRLGGKCGICGDPYNAPVKNHEAGGKYAKGIITRNYQQGQVIDVEVQITAEHKGYFEFRLCPWNNVTVPVTHKCLNRHLLEFNDGKTKWYLPIKPSEATGIHKLKVRLPSGVICDQCLLQWRYRTGNSWGNERDRSGLGLGQQEEFYGCSDVAVSRNGTVVPPSSPDPIPTPPTVPTSKPEGRSTRKPRLNRTRRPRPASTRRPRPNSNRRRRKKNCKKLPSGQYFFNNCKSYFQCVHKRKVVFQCPLGTRFNRKTAICDHPYNVPRPCGTARQ